MKPSPMPARLLALVPSFVVLAALLAGCSSGPPVLAKIGDRRITVDDFLDAASRSQEQYAPRRRPCSRTWSNASWW
jgi:hypothetical protein